MAISILQLPNKTLEPVYSPFYFVVSSGLNVSGNTNFKHVFKIESLTQPTYTVQTTLATIKLSARPDGTAIFSPGRILENTLSYDASNFFKTGFTVTTNSLAYYKITFGEEYSIDNSSLSYSSVTNNGGFAQFNFNSNPSLQVGDTIQIDIANKFINNDYDGLQTVTSLSATTGIVTSKPYGSIASDSGNCIYRFTLSSGNTYTGCCINFSKQYLEKNKNFIQENVLGSSNSIFLTTYNSNITIQENDPYVLSIFKTGSTFTGCIIVTTGYNNITKGLYLMSASTGNYSRIDLGVGTYNLSRTNLLNGLNSTIEPVFDTNVKSYSVTMCDSAIQAISNPITFIVKRCNDVYNYYRLAFLNRRGGFSFFNFNMKKKRKLNIDRTFISKPLNYNYSIGDVQEFGINTQTEEVLTLNSDWLTQVEGDYLEELLTSPVIFCLNNDLQEYYPFIITNKEWENKFQDNEPLFNLQIEGRFAFNLNLQRN